MEITLGAVEAKFADIIWEHEPVSSSELTKLCEEKLGWKRSTTFTVLKRLGTKGIFQNTNGTVTSLISREEFYARQSMQFVEENFQGSLPAFFAAFTSQKRLTDKEIEDIRRMIDRYGEE